MNEGGWLSGLGRSGFTEIVRCLDKHTPLHERSSPSKDHFDDDVDLSENLCKALASVALAEAIHGGDDLPARLEKKVDLWKPETFGGNLLILKNVPREGQMVADLLAMQFEGATEGLKTPNCPSPVVTSVYDFLDLCCDLRNEFAHQPDLGVDTDRGRLLVRLSQHLAPLVDTLMSLAYQKVLKDVRVFRVEDVKGTEVCLEHCGKSPRDESVPVDVCKKAFAQRVPTKQDQWYMTARGQTQWESLGPRFTEFETLRVFVKLLRKMADKPRELVKAVHYDDPLTTGFQDGSAVAVLGPDFGVPQRDTDPGAIDLAKRLGDVLYWKPKDTSDDLTGFLLDIVKRCAPEHLQLHRTKRSDSADRDNEPIAAAIWALGKLTQHAAVIFGQEVARGAIAPRDSSEWSIPISGDAAKELGPLVVDACEALKGIQPRRQQWAVGRDNSSLTTRLSSVFGKTTFYCDTLVWMCDAIWHLFRFDARYYPDQRSLAVQFDLCVDMKDGIPRTRPASTAALLAEKQSACILHLRQWMKNYLPGHAKPPGPTSDGCGTQFRILAHATHAAWAARNPQEDRKWDSPHGTPMVIIDTNLDQAIVNAVARLGVPYAVVFPIHDESQPVWGVRECPGQGRDNLWWIMRPLPEGGAAPQIGGLRGIVIVKPHGAPLEPLAPLTELRALGPGKQEPHPRLDGVGHVSGLFDRVEDHYSTVQDRVALRARILFDDYKVIANVVAPQDSLPPGLRRYLVPETSHEAPGDAGIRKARIRNKDGTAGHVTPPTPCLWFMGYPVLDFTRRVRIVADRRPTNHFNGQQPLRPASQLIPTSVPLDPVSKEFLNRDAVTVYATNLLSSLKTLAGYLELEDNE